MPFSIDEISGELFTTDTLDRETVAIYRLTVFGSDKHPTHPLSSSVLVTVLVGDVNDHWPQFLHSPYVANVPAEVAPGEETDSHLTDDFILNHVILRNMIFSVMIYLLLFCRLRHLCSESNRWRH